MVRMKRIDLQGVTNTSRGEGKEILLCNTIQESKHPQTLTLRESHQLFEMPHTVHTKFHSDKARVRTKPK